MKRLASSSWLAALLTSALLSSAFAQQAQTPQTQTQTPPASQTSQPSQTPVVQNEEDEVFRITSNLVQFDVTVRDKSGRPVTDLRPEDFEVIVDGKPQPVTVLSYVSTEDGTLRTERVGSAKRDAKRGELPAPSIRLRPEQVRRTVVLLVDDIGTSFQSMHFVRDGLKKFVNEQMQPGDLVAIKRTSRSGDSLDQFTSDKRVLLRAIERMRWNPFGRGGISPFQPEDNDPLEQALNPRANRSDRDRNDRTTADEIDDVRERNFTIAILNALNFVVSGLKELPGRKSVIMFSEGFLLVDKQGYVLPFREEIRRVTDTATRSSVVINTVDVRGAAYPGLTAADKTTGAAPSGIADRLTTARSGLLFHTQAGLSYLAEASGGLFMHNNNDLADSVRRVLEAQRDYYIIGFRPDESLFDQKQGRVRYNSVKINLKRPGLRVRTRVGFYGLAEGDAQPAPRTRHAQILRALASPLTVNDVPLRLTALFTGEPPDKSVVSSLLHIDASGFHFEKDADGWHRVVLDVVALTIGEGGQVVDEVNRTETVRASAKAHDEIRKRGLIFSMQVPVKKPGAYQLRVVVREAVSEKIGSASQFIEVPDLRKESLALSGIALSSAGATDAASSGEDVRAEEDVTSGPAVRRFRRGASFEYYYDIYNARIDKATGRPRLTTQTRVFLDGQPVFTGDVRPFDPGQQIDMRRFRSGGRINLVSDFKPGEYLLQVVVTDETAKEKQRVVTQWIDFEIVD